MKVKLAVAFAVLLSATFVRADSTPITIDISGTTCSCGIGDTTPISYSAQLTVEQMTGTWFFAGQAYFFTGTVDEVIALTGEVNGFPMTLSQAPFGDGSWVNPGDYRLGTIYFTGDGIPSWLMNDVTNYIEGFDIDNPVTYLAVDPATGVPEPSTWLFLVAGIGFVLMRAVKTPKQLAG